MQRVDQKLRLGIRPEHIRVSDKAGDDAPLRVELYSFEPTGAENLYVLKLGNCELTTRTSTMEAAHLSKEEGTALFAASIRTGFICSIPPAAGRSRRPRRAARSRGEQAMKSWVVLSIILLFLLSSCTAIAGGTSLWPASLIAFVVIVALKVINDRIKLLAWPMEFLLASGVIMIVINLGNLYWQPMPY